MKSLIRDSIVFQFYRILKVHQSYCGSRYEVVVFFFHVSHKIGWNQSTADVGNSIMFFFFVVWFCNHN